jgi:hypothetical protein
MSPAAALASPIFRFYVALIVILLLLAGGILGLLRWKSSRNVSHAWRAYRSWLLMIPLVLGAVFLGRAATIVLFMGLSLLGFKEFARATGLYRDWITSSLDGSQSLPMTKISAVSDQGICSLESENNSRCGDDGCGSAACSTPSRPASSMSPR